ncbi:Spermine/spermidine synthase [Singulisphaera sp. GP187]|uniref:spermine/spermidine synthase domain-containing protein n=1 Tax=Singulisphaera sp. GP187 TaxID=1882752 RepID=UPI000926ED8C|nr:hypothetical protein [Singulisphaera sp. GP187]SIO21979.1 Spermine/spermidine synthase [Singulisphaera sp. GP187]
MSTEVPPAKDDAATARACARRLFAMSFIALFLELLLIRWAPSVVRLVAYYANLLLVSSFLGLGWGALTSSRRWNLFRWFPLLVAGNIGVLLLCRTATLPDSGSEIRFFAAGSTAMNYLTLIGVFLANAVLFIPLGEQIGELFGRLPTLRAYTWDLLGSLTGTLSFGLFSFLFFSPVLGMAAILIVVLALSARKHWIWNVPTVLVCLGALAWSNPSGAIWSPYYYITVHDPNQPAAIVPPPPADLRTMRNPPIYSVSVNQDFYQMHGTIDLERYAPDAPQARLVRYLRDQYLLPYTLATGRTRVAVLGAGGGMDMEAALLSGARTVDAVDIDPKLIELSRRDNAAGCYDDPRVSVHVNDARAFLQNARPGYDLVVFGFLDSQALFTSMSNLRLDGFTYTVESLRTAYRLLNDGGMLSLVRGGTPLAGGKDHSHGCECNGDDPDRLHGRRPTHRLCAEGKDDDRTRLAVRSIQPPSLRPRPVLEDRTGHRRLAVPLLTVQDDSGGLSPGHRGEPRDLLGEYRPAPK